MISGLFLVTVYRFSRDQIEGDNGPARTRKSGKRQPSSLKLRTAEGIIAEECGRSRGEVAGAHNHIRGPQITAIVILQAAGRIFVSTYIALITHH